MITNLKSFKKCTEEQYNDANNLSPNNTAYIRIGSGRFYYLRKKIIPEMNIESKTITLTGRKCDIEKALKKIKLGKVNVK